MFEQGSDAREEAAGCATVEDAVVDGQGEVGFHDRHELAFTGIPTGDLAACPHAQDQGLLGQWDRRRPGEAEGAEVRERGRF